MYLLLCYRYFGMTKELIIHSGRSRFYIPINYMNRQNKSIQYVTATLLLRCMLNQGKSWKYMGVEKTEWEPNEVLLSPPHQLPPPAAECATGLLGVWDWPTCRTSGADQHLWLHNPWTSFQWGRCFQVCHSQTPWSPPELSGKKGRVHFTTSTLNLFLGSDS